jgi:hypothetical protein
MILVDFQAASLSAAAGIESVSCIVLSPVWYWELNGCHYDCD